MGWPLALSLAALTGALCGYSVLILRALRHGRFHEGMTWANSAVMVSIPAAVFVIDWHFHGSTYALTTPPLVAWGALIGVCALRTEQRLAYAMGALAALEYLALYFLLAWPQLPPDALSTLSPPLMLVRALFLFAYGPLAAMLSGHLVRKAEEALRAVREQDVMGKYFLHERLGAGGMAEVFRATYSPEGGFEKQVAVKRVLPAYADSEDFIIALGGTEAPYPRGRQLLVEALRHARTASAASRPAPSDAATEPSPAWAETRVLR